MYVPKGAREEGALGFARTHARRSVAYAFTTAEEQALRLFFTNSTRNVFVVHNLPSNVAAALLAMYSRMKNERGLRGVFLDGMLPYFIVSKMLEGKPADEVAAFIKENRIRKLDDLLDHSEDARREFGAFLSSCAGDPDYVQDFANSEKIRNFLSQWLDRYGHNSIARMGIVTVCCEQVSILAAKALEHVRPGAGFIELSTRFVDMSRADWYPFPQEMFANGDIKGDERGWFDGHFQYHAKTYQEQSIMLESFLLDRYDGVSQMAVMGEVCDVMANVLPCATLTSVGCSVSGEAVRSLIQVLLMEGLPETTALAELLIEEIGGTGLGQFVRHVEPSEFAHEHARYLEISEFEGLTPQEVMRYVSWNPRYVEDQLYQALKLTYGIRTKIEDFLASEEFLKGRASHDKLPPVFENGQVRFARVMTFRTWRDIQRHTMAGNERTLVTPYLGFFGYEKPLNPELMPAMGKVEGQGARAYQLLADRVSPDRLQYVLSLGFNVGATITANLRHMEFFTWQRSGSNVNHEARSVALSCDADLLKAFSWWKYVSRTDRTQAYRLAREEPGIPL